MPAGIPFIISNEFAERFCFYGINSILAVYMVSNLQFTDAKAASWQSTFKAGAYFFPMMGAIISDVFWGKFRTIMIFSLVYAAGCVALALLGSTEIALAASLFFVAMGTGGIKPCVSTNVGDQFTAKNSHLIERAFSWFYLAINLGSSISIYFCPVLLKDPNWGAKWAFGLPASMMVVATLVFVAGRTRYAHVPPAGKKWLEDVTSPAGRRIIFSLLGIYFFVAVFWMLWDQSNGNTWTLQAQSSLVDKNLGFGFTLLPAQLQIVNGFFILALAPLFSYVVYPLVGRFTKVTPLRKIGAGLFITGLSFVVVARIEQRIQGGETVSAWWQILAYVILTAGEVLVSITALEFSYKQAPLRMKSFIMGLFLFSTTVGNLGIAAVNNAMIRPLHATNIETGTETWVAVEEASEFAKGQKIDITGDTGLFLPSVTDKDGKVSEVKLNGTFMVSDIDGPGKRVKLMDAVDRKPIATTGTFNLKKTEVSTYWLVGPMYFVFFIGVMLVAALAFIVYASFYKEQDFVRTDDQATT
jgi:POT family proton-dependent oligopeptide transporter